jgi:phage repressor protein C with HTH and peptisase S24 domain
VTFADRLDVLIGEFSGGNKAAFARFCGVQESSIRQYATGTKPSLDNLLLIKRATKYPLDWLVGDDIQQNYAESPRPVAEVNDEGAFALIPRYDVRASAGAGALVPAEEVSDFLAFKRGWFSRVGLSPQNAALVTADGDSMEPTIPNGAVLLLDLSIKEVANGYIYAIRREGELLVKRVQHRIDGTIVLISDNPRYEREEIRPERLLDLHVVGRVRWIGHDL